MPDITISIKGEDAGAKRTLDELRRSLGLLDSEARTAKTGFRAMFDPKLIGSFAAAQLGVQSIQQAVAGVARAFTDTVRVVATSSKPCRA
jgi:hypothetical protein